MRMIVDARWTVLLGSVLLLCTLITGVPLHENDPIAAAPRDEAGSRGEWLASWSARAAQLLNSGVAIKDHVARLAALAAMPAKPDNEICDNVDWRKASLRLLKELPAEALFADTKDGKRFELSGVTRKEGEMFMIFDSLDYIGKTDEMFEYRDPANVLIGTQVPAHLRALNLQRTVLRYLPPLISHGPCCPSEGKEESGFEAIMSSADTGTFLIVREAVENIDGIEAGGFFPSIVEATISGDDYEIQSECKVDYEFPSASKGFEGALYFSRGGERYVLGLCEGNHCTDSKKGKEPGFGMAVLTQLGEDSDGNCVWKTVKELKVPKSAFFQDYADISLHDDGKTVAVVSQEEAAVWVGGLDTDKWEFVDSPGLVYHFPRSIDCEVIYCNIEGVTFLEGNRIMTTSDASKSAQSYNCVEKAQSVQVFSFPGGLPTADIVSHGGEF